MLALATLVVGSAALRSWLAQRTVVPWVIPDELVYLELAQSLATSGTFKVRDAPFPFWSFGPLYPAIIAVVYAVTEDLDRAYTIVKAVNSVLWSTAAVPLYLLSRRVLAPSAALAAAAIGILIPAVVFTTRVMTESLAYPLFLVAFLAVVRALERPSTMRQLMAVAAIGLGALARGQLIALLPAYATAVAMLAMHRSAAPAQRQETLRRSLARFSPTWTVFLLVGAATAATHVFAERPLTVAVGRAIVGADETGAGEVVASFIHHLALLDLHVGVVPLAAFIVFVGTGLRTEAASRASVVLAITSASVAVWLTLVAAVYVASIPPSASGVATRVYDRYVFYLAPLLLVALAAWVTQGVHVRRRWAWGAAATAALLPATLPIRDLLGERDWGTDASSVALVPWAILRLVAGEGAVYPTLVTACLLLGAVFAFSSGRRRYTVVASVAVMLATGGLAYLANEIVADEVRTIGVGDDPQWIDEAVGHDAEVVVIWAGLGREPERLIWGHEAFNRSVGRVYHVGPRLRYAAAGDGASIRARRVVAESGEVVDASYVLTDSLDVVGHRVAADPRTGLVLYEVSGSLRVRRSGS